MTLFDSVKKGAVQGAQYGTVIAGNVAAVSLFSGAGLLYAAQQKHANTPVLTVWGMIAILFGVAEIPFVFTFSLVFCTAAAAGRYCMRGAEEESVQDRAVFHP